MKKLVITALTCMTLAATALPAAAAEPSSPGPLTEYVVLYDETAAPAAARAAVEAAGGTVVKENSAVGVATVTSTNTSFVMDAAAQPALDGAAQDRAIGRAPQLARKQDGAEIPAGLAGRLGTAPERQQGRPAEPLAHLQWDMDMIRATAQGAHALQPGSHAVKVGVLDTGIDASHPDLAPNFDHELSRNFTTDIPEVDGPCEEEPDASCQDPADVDEHGHGTHVAGTIAAAANGLGIAGVAPGVRLVNLRAGQDSGYFFLQATVDALTYAGDHGVDVVNMSYYIDPWLYNCPDNPADSPEDQLEQRTIIAATQRALDYAHDRNVTLVSAAGNGHTDLGNPIFDDTSPDFPPGEEYEREVDNSCLNMPTEGEHVIVVTAVGPSGRKAYYSDYGVEQANVAAPGGDFNDFPGTDRYRTWQTLILSTYPESVLRELGLIDEAGTPTTDRVVQDCQGGTCAYYFYLQGTSMASPHAAGVAALIVAERGWPELRRPRELWMRPDRVQRVLERSATDTACPEPRLQQYIAGPAGTHDPTFDAFCEGNVHFNGFYGHGVINAQAAVSRIWD